MAVRALDVRRPMIGLCPFLEGEGGGAPFVDFCESHLDAKLIVSACRGEVFIFETPSHTILRINNFDFHACCIECALTYERTHSQTFAQSDIQRLCDFDQRHNDYFSRHALAHNVRSCVYVCTCVHSIVCLCMQASTIHSHAIRPASAAAAIACANTPVLPKSGCSPSLPAAAAAPRRMVWEDVAPDILVAVVSVSFREVGRERVCC